MESRIDNESSKKKQVFPLSDKADSTNLDT